MQKETLQRVIDYIEAENGNNPSFQGRELLNLLQDEQRTKIGYDSRERVHKLKTWGSLFLKMLTGDKTFEIRKVDRDFRENDLLLLQEYDIADGYTGREFMVRVRYILRNAPEFGLAKGYCIMSVTQCGAYMTVKSRIAGMHGPDAYKGRPSFYLKDWRDVKWIIKGVPYAVELESNNHWISESASDLTLWTSIIPEEDKANFNFILP